jgi:tetratricopeptide (TPR) repeat protein
MQSYGVRDVERVLQLSRSTIRSLVEGGFVRPTRGARRELRFSFQDLVVLRAARALLQARVPSRRIRRSLKDLRSHLPATVPLSGLSICAIGERVVVREGRNHWDVNDGQYLLGLDVQVDGGALRVAEWREPASPQPQPQQQPQQQPQPPLQPSESERWDADHWFECALGMESSDLEGALRAYRRAVELDPDYAAAWINWGRLLHQQGRHTEAERIYRQALSQCHSDALLWFNLGVLLEDEGHISSALDAYQRALGEDPEMADCHYNLARLYDSLGKPQHAIRHLGQYRRLLTDSH